MSRYSNLFVAILFAISAIPTNSWAGGSRVASAEAAIRAADQSWSRVFAARDLARSVGMCEEGASVLAPNAPRATGRKAIGDLFAGFFSLPELKISWQPSEIHVAKSGEIGYSTGSYAMSSKDPKTGKLVPDHGKYATIWKKQSDGSWKVTLDIFNSDLPEPGGS